ncbi:unnamed protein product [Paramecium octaurelia]|uniref:Uncharacterized protein n=1 Tax=Paramecium octaurelia TaxID=43137 RepID=A0A8S1THW3_PAROT|nr:unnamed protein product [Paramecium octaurelia]
MKLLVDHIIIFVKPDGSVRTGRNTLNLFETPLKRHQQDESNLSQSGINQTILCMTLNIAMKI